MALSIGLVKIAGATRCNKWGRHNKQSIHKLFSISLSQWLSDSSVYVKRMQKKLKIDGYKEDEN